MRHEKAPSSQSLEHTTKGLNRRSAMTHLCGLGALAALGLPVHSAQAASGSDPRHAELMVRWLGGGVVELATPDYKQMAYCDAWVWNNAGWDRFSIAKPPEYASREGFIQYLRGKNPDAIFVLLTHDHGDHMGDYLEMLKAMSDAGLPVKTTGQSDLMRAGLVEDFRKSGIDPVKVVANHGAGMNFGGVSRHGNMTAHLVPAVHSNIHGHPAAGFMLDIGGARVYVSGDTDLFGELKILGERYHPDLAIVCVGDGPFTMGPEDAARACQWLGVSHALPVHYAHNAMVKGIEAGHEFQRALQKLSPATASTVAKPGEVHRLRIA
jgi:L-ascorbate metabolism protein UlaG (beta-lactamase superfamily)